MTDDELRELAKRMTDADVVGLSCDQLRRIGQSLSARMLKHLLEGYYRRSLDTCEHCCLVLRQHEQIPDEVMVIASRHLTDESA